MTVSENSILLTDEELARVRPITLSVIGPTNEGKTSVLRTLSGDPDFGEVNSLTGTTARAEYQKIFHRDQAEILRLVDTPGFQMSGAICERLETETSAGCKPGAAAILAAIPADDGDFRHDRRAWTEVAASDIVIYIANAAESPRQSLLRDTLELLFCVDRPVIVLFNNIAPEKTNAVLGEKPNEAGEFFGEWTEALTRGGLHMFQVFDAHRRRFENEYALFEKICALIHDPLSLKAIRAELFERLRLEKLRMNRSRRIIAEMMLDIATLSATAENVSAQTYKNDEENLRRQLGDLAAGREHEAHRQLLELWRFHVGILDRKRLSIENDLNENDYLFGKKWKEHSLGGAKYGAIGGAAFGLLLDAATAGLSLGTGTAIGALLGGALGGALGGCYNHVYDKREKRITARIGRSVFAPLLARGVELTKQLQRRGQATADSIQLLLSAEPLKIAAPEFFALLNETSRETDWSAICRDLSDLSENDRRKRAERIAQLADALEPVLRVSDEMTAYTDST